MFEFRELKLFKPVWTFQKQTTGFLFSVTGDNNSLSFSAKSVAQVEKISEEKIYVSASFQELSAARWYLFFFF